MVPSFEKRVRAFAIDTSGVALFTLLTLPLGQIWSYIVFGVAFFGLYILPYFIANGQTFGKRIQKIKIVNADGSPAGLIRILLRDIFKLGASIGTFGLYLVIAFFVLSDKSSQTIHDYLFKTKVIDLEGPQGKDNFLGRGESMRKRGFE
ncbi:MAG: RDD family protein [Acholeplasmataceae bacterium]|nr:MAG: RDD family protein [Acholeplasmataceae bacterium]